MEKLEYMELITLHYENCEVCHFMDVYNNYLLSRLSKVLPFYFRQASSRWVLKTTHLQALTMHQLLMLSIIYGLLVNDTLFIITAMNMLQTLEGTRYEVTLSDLSKFVLKFLRLTNEQMAVIGFRLRNLQQLYGNAVPNNMIGRFNIVINILNIQIPEDMMETNYILPEECTPIQEVEEYIQTSSIFRYLRNSILSVMQIRMCDGLYFIKPYSDFSIRYLIICLHPFQFYLLMFLHAIFIRNPAVFYFTLPIFSSTMEQIANSPFTVDDMLTFLMEDFHFPKELYKEGLKFFVGMIPEGRNVVLPRLLRKLIHKLAEKYDVSLPKRFILEQ